MNIPKSYEALAADLASEKIISKTLQGQKESYMMLADGRKFDLDAIQQRLTVAEQRAVKFEGLLLQTNELLYQIQGDPGAVPSSSVDAMRGEVFTALKPCAEGEGS